MNAPLTPELLRACQAVFAYHDATKHTPEKLRSSRHYLDWETMPDPFRHYEGVPLLDLPGDSAPLETDALRVLFGSANSAATEFGTADPIGALSQLLFYSASVSATKVSPSGSRYALRVNPSSGNLHPTEFHLLARGFEGLHDGAWHYRPSAHMLENYGDGDFLCGLEEASGVAMPARGIVILLASILWREAWKYQSRAYRYCLHDLGHAWQSVAHCGEAMGLHFRAIGNFADAAVKTLLGLDDEEPMLLLVADLGGKRFAGEAPARDAARLAAPQKNALSPSQIHYPLIDGVHAATCLNVPAPLLRELILDRAESAGDYPLGPPLSECGESFASVVRRRRSALDFRGGDENLSAQHFATMLRAAAEPLDADFLGQDGLQSRLAGPSPLIELWLYIHRVEELPRGLYRYDVPSQSLDLRKQGDQRVTAAALSLQQQLAGNACVAFSMVGDFAAATGRFGNRGYRYLHFLAGAVGQRLYLASHALGFGATGIGAFFDDYVHAHLGLNDKSRQVIYHFACGYPVHDPRLSDE